MLVAARVGETDRPHLAVRPLLHRQPLDGVVAVLGLQREWIPLTLGVVAAADVGGHGAPHVTVELILATAAMAASRSVASKLAAAICRPEGPCSSSCSTPGESGGRNRLETGS